MILIYTLIIIVVPIWLVHTRPKEMSICKPLAATHSEDTSLRAGKLRNQVTQGRNQFPLIARSRKSSIRLTDKHTHGSKMKVVSREQQMFLLVTENTSPLTPIPFYIVCSEQKHYTDSSKSYKISLKSDWLAGWFCEALNW